MTIADLQFGKQEPTEDVRDFKVTPNPQRKSLDIPFETPESFGYGRWFKSWPMLGNGRDETLGGKFGANFRGCGNCVLAAAAHEIMALGLRQNQVIEFDAAMIVQDYMDATGYDPRADLVNGVNPTNNGANVRAIMEYRRKIGIADVTGKLHKLLRYARLPSRQENLTYINDAFYTFGQLGFGLRLTATMIQEFLRGDPWLDTEDKTKIGGHYVAVIDRRPGGMYHVVCWGKDHLIGPDVVRQKADEIWTGISPELFVHGRTLEGFTWEEMKLKMAPP